MPWPGDPDADAGFIPVARPMRWMPSGSMVLLMASASLCVVSADATPGAVQEVLIPFLGAKDET
jgi:hypothetical protein